jgi:hypothetical protein
MRLTLTETSLALETAHYRGTGGVSENNRSLGFQPAFIDRETEAVHLSCFPAGRLAPYHLRDACRLSSSSRAMSSATRTKARW